MSTLIAIYTGKGGVGKSTISICLHDTFNRNHVKTKLVDADPQRSIYNLSQVNNLKLDVCTTDAYTKLTELLDSEYKLIIADLPPYLSNNGSSGKKTKEILINSNLVLMPLTASPLDVMAIYQTQKELKELSPSIRCVAFLNMVTPNSSLTKRVEDLLQEYNIEYLQTKIGRRTAYGHALFSNGSIYQTGNRKAKDEIQALSIEVFNYLVN